MEYTYLYCIRAYLPCEGTETHLNPFLNPNEFVYKNLFTSVGDGNCTASLSLPRSRIGAYKNLSTSVGDGNIALVGSSSVLMKSKTACTTLISPREGTYFLIT